MYHGNLKVCWPRNLLLLSLLTCMTNYTKLHDNSKFYLLFMESCLKPKKPATYTPNKGVNFFIVYELDWLSRDLDSDFTFKNCLFGGVKLAKNANPNKYSYSGYGIRFDTRIEFSLPDSSVGKNVVVFGVDMSLSVHIDNKWKDILILGKGPTLGLDETTLTAETQYLITFTRPNIKFLFKPAL